MDIFGPVQCCQQKKFDADFMSMMRKFIKGIEARKTWLKERKNLMKVSQTAVLLYFWDACGSYLCGELSMHNTCDCCLKNHIAIKNVGIVEVLF